MTTFTDTEGRSWEVHITTNALKRVHSLTGENIDTLFDEKTVDRLCTDYVFIADALYAVCKPQADERGVTDEQFGEALAGEPLEKAIEALLEALVDFFPPKRQATARRLVKAFKKLETTVFNRVNTRLDTLDLEQTADQVMSSESFTNSPASSASTPED